MKSRTDGGCGTGASSLPAALNSATDNTSVGRS
jgi:hypothetical protein